ncbi:hypothetical protein BHE74_00055590, partial [Ensete ventricosum]
RVEPYAPQAKVGSAAAQPLLRYTTDCGPKIALGYRKETLSRLFLPSLCRKPRGLLSIGDSRNPSADFLIRGGVRFVLIDSALILRDFVSGSTSLHGLVNSRVSSLLGLFLAFAPSWISRVSFGQ